MSKVARELMIRGSSRVARAIKCLGVVVISGTISTPTVAAQKPPATFDTLKLSTNQRAVYRVWNAYLISKAGKRDMRSDTPSPYWLMSEQQRLPGYDLASLYLLRDAEPRILSIERASTRGDSVYRITTEFRPPAGDNFASPWDTLMTVTVYAVRAGRDWKLSGALSRSTAAWRRDTVGPITYVYATDYPYNRARAQRAVAFTDSLSLTFGVPKLAPMTYFLARTFDEAYAIMGLEAAQKAGAIGALSQPVNHLLFSGDPKLGEEYRHELVHFMVAPLSASENTQYFYNEGVATWLGGTIGLTYKDALKGLGEYLREHPTVTLDSLINQSGPQTQLYRGGALLAAMVYERGGMPAVKLLFDPGPSQADFRAAVARIMQQPWNRVISEWRKRALNAIKPDP